MLAGLVLAAVIIGIWVDRGFGALSEERLAVLAAALIIIGIQIFFSSFLLSILGLRRRDVGMRRRGRGSRWRQARWPSSSALAHVLTTRSRGQSGSNYVRRVEPGRRRSGPRACGASGGQAVARRHRRGADPARHLRTPDPGGATCTATSAGRRDRLGKPPQAVARVTWPCRSRPSTATRSARCASASSGRRAHSAVRLAGDVRLEWLRPGSESWLEILPTVDRRFGYGKANAFGAWLLPIAGLVLALAGAWLLGWSCASSGAARLRRLPAAALMVRRGGVRQRARLAVVTPPFHVPDETVHVAYVQYLAETGGSQTSPGQRVLRRAVRPAGRARLQLGGGQPSRTHHCSERRTARCRRRAPPAEPVSGGGTAEGSNQPPLYYALRGGRVPGLAVEEPARPLWVMRVLSALLGAVTLFVYLFLRELFPEPWTWTMGALAVAFQPLFGFVGSGVTPDTLLFATSAALFWVLARAFRRGLTPRLGAGIGRRAGAGDARQAELPGPRARRGSGHRVARVARAPRPGARRAAAGAALACAIVVAVAAHVRGAQRDSVGPRRLGRRPGRGRQVGDRSGAAPGDPNTLNEQLSYTWQLYLPRLPFMNEQFAGFPAVGPRGSRA